MRPFSGPNFIENSEMISDDEESCVVCGKGVKKSSDAPWVRVVDGGSRFAMPDEEVDVSGDMGVFPIGPSCFKAHREELERFIVETEDFGQLMPREPVDDLVTKPIPASGLQAIFKGFDLVAIPEELGGGTASIVGRLTLEGCPCCGDSESTPATKTDRQGPNGRPIAVISCLKADRYAWLELPE